MKWVALLLVSVGLALPGCATGGDGGAAPSSSSASGSSADLDGVVLEVVHTGSGHEHRLDATARNTGLRAYYYLWVPQCDLHPWSDSMAGPDGAVTPRQPTAHCLPCGWDVFSPGETLTRSFDWDERIWDHEDQRMQDAPAGRYVWTATFRAEPEDADVCGGDRAVSASVSVDVG